MYTQGCLGICLEFESFTTETRFINNSRSKQHPKNPFVDIGKMEMCGKFQQNIKLYGWSLSKFSNFQGNNMFFHN